MAIATLIAVILLAVVAVVFTFTGAKEQYDSFSEWTNTLEDEQILFAKVQNGYTSNEPHYELTSLETRELLELIQSIPEESCFRGKQTVGQLEDYHLDFTVEKTEEEWQTIIFHCLEDGTLLVIYDSEMGNFAGEGMDNIDLIVKCDELWNYIVDTVDEKGRINVKENPSDSEQTSDTEDDLLIGSTEDDDVYATTPAIEINHIFERTNAVNMSLYQANTGALNAYEIKENEYGAGRLSYICEAFEWTKIDNPDLSTCQFWISVESKDGVEKMTFYDVGDGIIECSWNTGYKIYWQGTKNEEIIGVSSLWGEVRHVFDNLEANTAGLIFEASGDAEDAARIFAYEIYGALHMNLSPGNMYGFSEYEVVEFDIEEISEDGTEVTAWMTYAFVPWDINSLGIWAGNTDYATGEYEGKLWTQTKYTLVKQTDGSWVCKGVGTG